MIRIFNIVEIPMLTLYIATDRQRRIRLSTDIVEMYDLRSGNRVSLGYDPARKAIAIRLAASKTDPRAANVDMRGYISASRFFKNTQLTPESRRYVFEAEHEGWLVFVAEEVRA